MPTELMYILAVGGVLIVVVAIGLYMYRQNYSYVVTQESAQPSQCGPAYAQPSSRPVHVSTKQTSPVPSQQKTETKKQSYKKYKAAMLSQQAVISDRDDLGQAPSSGHNMRDLFESSSSRIRSNRLRQLQKQVSKGISPPSNGLF